MFVLKQQRTCKSSYYRPINV